MIRPPRRRAPQRLVAASGLLALLALLELVAGIQGPAICHGDGLALLQSDSEVGWTFRPELTVHLNDCRGTGWSSPVSINREGLADQPWPHEKRPGRVRVLLLGGTVGDGLGVAREDRLSVRLSYLADASRGSPVSVVNASIPGYATAEQLRWLEARGLAYDPDVVVLVLDPSHDLAANHRSRRANAVSQELDLAPSSGLLAWSAAARWLLGTPPDRTAPPPTATQPSPLEAGDLPGAIGRTRELVRELARVSRARGATFAILVAPPCGAPAPPVALCSELDDLAPCIDPTPTFDGLRASTNRPLELCLGELGRWGRDGHFLASHALWDLLVTAGVWPDGVVRGHRL